MNTYHLTTPLNNNMIEQLNVGDTVYLTGIIYTARDMAHYSLKKIFDNNETFEEDFEGQAIFHAGPIVHVEEDKNKYTMVAIGPTSSIRMEPYSDMMGAHGVKALIGKGGMGDETTKAMQKHKMVYLVAAHGCAAVHTKKVKSIEKQYWMNELGMPEAIWVLRFEEFGPLIVGIDSKGRNLFQETKQASLAKVKAVGCN